MVTAQENEPPPEAAEYGLETDSSSRYLFRGFPFSQEPVNQTSVWTSFSGVSFYALGNVLLEREPGQNDFNELDFGGSYSHELGRLTLEPAFDAYLFRVPAPRTAPHTVETSLKASWDLGPIRSLHPPDHRPAIQSGRVLCRSRRFLRESDFDERLPRRHPDIRLGIGSVQLRICRSLGGRMEPRGHPGLLHLFCERAFLLEAACRARELRGEPAPRALGRADGRQFRSGLRLSPLSSTHPERSDVHGSVREARRAGTRAAARAMAVSPAVTAT